MNSLDAFKSSGSASFRKKNPILFGEAGSNFASHDLNGGGEDDAEHDHIEALTAKRKANKRIRQSSKPELNKLEAEWFSRLPLLSGVRPQSIKFKLARNVFYKPDFFSIAQLTAWEVKGLKGKNIDRGKLALKVAATAWPEIKFILVWKDAEGVWQEQHVLP
jgi:hypothetical protein